MEYAKRDLYSLTRWLQGLLYLDIGIDLLSFADDGYQRSVFQRLMAQGAETAKAVQTTNHTGLWAHDFVSLPLTGVGVASTILAAIWIYRAAANLRALRAPGLTISPGWAVGWYFIPIANFWKPYQAMREIWQASARPQQWQGSGTSPLLPAWWGLWLLSFLIPWSIFFQPGMLELHADVAGSWLINNVLQMVESLIHIPLNLVFGLLIGKVWRMQSDHALPPPSSILATGTSGNIG